VNDEGDDEDIDVVGDTPPLPPPLPAENAAQNAQNRPRSTGAKVYLLGAKPIWLAITLCMSSPDILD
jgi:hypothetical protein